MTSTVRTDAIRLPLDTTTGITALTGAVTACCEQAEDARPAALVLDLGTGTPAWPGTTDVHAVNKWERAVRRLERLDTVVVAVAPGECGGPALELLTAADVRIAGPGLRISLPVETGGFWPGMAVHRLTHRIGATRTRRLVLARAGGGALTAAESLDLDLVDEIAENAQDIDERVAAVLAGCPSGAEPRLLRSLVLDAVSTPFDEALGAHLAACDRAMRAASAAH